MNRKFFFLIFLFFFAYANESDSLIQKNSNDLWKISLFPQFNMASIGQLQNDKPLKALALTGMKIYWLDEFKIAQKAMNLSNRSRAFWWFLFLYFYTVIDASFDEEMKSFPDDKYKMKEGK
tara:strand:+ start:413 stop:775 length:363 start_codon:yes stop_codon:yes gene_type:complete